MAQLKLGINIDVEDSEVERVLGFFDDLLKRKESLAVGEGVPATPKQISYLKRLGYTDDPSVLSKREASDKISELEAKP